MLKPFASRPRHTTFALVLTSLALGATSTQAQASDASLRTTVASQERRIKAVAAEFPDATLNLVSAVGRERAASASGELEVATRRLRAAVVKQQATTSPVKRARSQYLRAAQQTLDGLAAFDEGLAAFDPDAPSKVAAALRDARARIAAASIRRARAARIIGARAR